MSEDPPTPPRQLRKRLLRALLTAAVLALVALNVPWSDRLTLGGEEFAGRLLGDWKGESVRFRFRPRPDLAQDSALAQTPVGSAIRHGGEVAVASDHAVSPAWSRAADGRPVGSGPVERVALAASWRPGIPHAFGDLDWGGLLPAMAFALLGSIFAVTRWWRLLALAGCPLGWTTAFRLTYVGLFFNLVLPGLNGGDLARAVLVVRDHPRRRADALMSVILDRAIGLFAMLVLAAGVVFCADPAFARLRAPVALGAVGFIVVLALFLNPRLRRLVRFEHWIVRLPQGRRLQKLDQALREHMRRPLETGLAFLLSVGNHLCVTAQIWTLGHAFGDELPFLSYLGVVTIANTISSLPATPGGIGVGEAAYGSLFALLGSPAGLGVATSLTYRLTTALLGLGGGLFLLLPGSRGARRDLARATSEPVSLGEAVE